MTQLLDDGIVVRRRWHSGKGVGLMIQGLWVRYQHWPHLRITSLGKVLTQIVFLSTQEYIWVPGPSAVCGCTLLYAAKHSDQGVRCKVG